MNDLKKIAEGLGYEGFPVIDGGRVVKYHVYTSPKEFRADLRRSIEYNPETNPAQLIELEDWLMDKRWRLERDEYNRYCWRSYRTVLVHESRAQAAIAAALEEMKEE